jgi:hypothetical protein
MGANCVERRGRAREAPGRGGRGDKRRGEEEEEERRGGEEEREAEERKRGRDWREETKPRARPRRDPSRGMPDLWLRFPSTDHPC